MTPFLKQVADIYYKEDNIGRRCFVFPNRRAMVFFRKYLSEAVASTEGAAPMFVPEMMTVNDFFYRAGKVRAADRVTLLLELYGCYKSLNPKAEPLDEFIFWGDVILGDFNDVDKYLVDPGQIFTNVSDFRKLQDTYSYLTDNQRQAIERFVSHFNDRSGKLTVDIGSDNANVKSRFLQIWNILEPLYRKYRSCLSDKGIAYEGMVYRSFAEMLSHKSVTDVLDESFGNVDKYVFVGLNALNECEKTVLRRMRDAGVAEFCWDYSGDMIQDPHNRSSFFMSENVREFPQSHKWDADGVAVPKIRIYSVPSSIGQVKRLPDIFRQIADENAGGDLSKVGGLEASGADCAVVLPDENLLIPLLNTVPPEIGDINVTMGYPMSSSSFYSFMRLVSAVQLHTRERGGVRSFYYRQVWDLFSNGIFRRVMGEEDLETVKAVKSAAKIYIPEDDLHGTPLFDAVFVPVLNDLKSASKEQIEAFAGYQLGVISLVAPKLKTDASVAVEMDFAKEYWNGVSRLKAYGLEILPVTYMRLVEQLMSGVSVPFRGEPLKGLQVMGPLETRVLDFSNVVILSANEGVFPRRSVSSSFIPPELRRGFGLPTYEYQDSVWAYYFYRMITRAKNVWLLYDSRTEGLKSGEESRYIKQLVYHFHQPVWRYVQKADTGEPEQEPEIGKTAEDVEIIRKTALSASALQNYLICPARFYYHTVRRLVPEDEVTETLDAGMFGNVYHNAMWALYSGEEAMAEGFITDKTAKDSGLKHPLETVTMEYIDSWLARREDIRRKVLRLIGEQIKSQDVTGRNLVVADVIVKYVMRTLEHDRELMQGYGVSSFRIIGLEKSFRADFGGYRFKGYLDRLDSFRPGEVRVVDYKTGKVLPEDTMITDVNAERIADLVFGEDHAKWPKIALQFFIYDMLLKQNGFGDDIVNSVYSTARLFNDPVEDSPMNMEFYRCMEERLHVLLEELSDPAVPFRRTEDVSRCQYCDFKVICGR